MEAVTEDGYDDKQKRRDRVRACHSRAGSDNFPGDDKNDLRISGS